MSSSQAADLPIKNEVKPLSHLSLDGFPPIFTLPLHLSGILLEQINQKLINSGATVTSDITEARIILASITTPRRAQFELQIRKLRTKPVQKHVAKVSVPSLGDGLDKIVSKKRRKISKGSFDSENHVPPKIPFVTTGSTIRGEHTSALSSPNLDHDKVKDNSCSAALGVFEEIPAYDLINLCEVVKVVKLDWLDASIEAGTVQPLDHFLIYEGTTQKPDEDLESTSPRTEPSILDSQPTLVKKNPKLEHGVMREAVRRAAGQPSSLYSRSGRKERNRDRAQNIFAGHGFVSSAQHGENTRGQYPRLIRETTLEHEEANANSLPEMPQWVKDKVIYACQRSTPAPSPNDPFIDLLKIIKEARVLTGDEIGVRAYSTAIASLAAYPHHLTSTREVLALPGCDEKLADLFDEYHATGHIAAVDEINADPDLTILRQFYKIHGVGAPTAREFLYERGWRDLDDIIEYGWSSLNRVQQIGLKFYDSFQKTIPRSESEFIASVVTYHAKQLVDDGIQCVIVGGYRRGKVESGDVDMVLSHRREEATKHLVRPLVEALERSNWITHTLTIHETNSDRDQQPTAIVPRLEAGQGFDTLDKALVVWQDPHWSTPDTDLASESEVKNPNPRRRVDIIISPWRTVGCAVTGWTSGTTFQRDLRRYTKHVKGWKFDSSGVRERGTGRWIDLERWRDPTTRATKWEDAERRVFDGMGLTWIPPEERCTG